MSYIKRIIEALTDEVNHHNLTEDDLFDYLEAKEKEKENKNDKN